VLIAVGGVVLLMRMMPPVVVVGMHELSMAAPCYQLVLISIHDWLDLQVYNHKAPQQHLQSRLVKGLIYCLVLVGSLRGVQAIPEPCNSNSNSNACAARLRGPSF
jgi:hypothetical protein